MILTWSILVQLFELALILSAGEAVRMFAMCAEEVDTNLMHHHLFQPRLIVLHLVNVETIQIIFGMKKDMNALSCQLVSIITSNISIRTERIQAGRVACAEEALQILLIMFTCFYIIIGKLLLFLLAFTDIANSDRAGQSKLESGIFGMCTRVASKPPTNSSKPPTSSKIPSNAPHPERFQPVFYPDQFRLM